MNLDERIEVAWKELSGGMEVATTRDRDLFSAGYLAALQQALEVDFEKCDQVKESNAYWAMVPDIGWRKGVVVAVGLGLDFTWMESGSWHVIRASTATRYCRVCDWLPSPAEIF